MCQTLTNLSNQDFENAHKTSPHQQNCPKRFLLLHPSQILGLNTFLLDLRLKTSETKRIISENVIVP